MVKPTIYLLEYIFLLQEFSASWMTSSYTFKWPPEHIHKVKTDMVELAFYLWKEAVEYSTSDL